MLRRNKEKLMRIRCRNQVMEARMIRQFKHIGAEEAIIILVEFGIVAYAAMIVLKVIKSYSLF